MKIIALCVLIALTQAVLFDAVTDGWTANAEIDFQGMNIERVEFMDLKNNFEKTQNTITAAGALSWFDQYNDFENGVLYHHDASGCQAFHYEAFNVEAYLTQLFDLVVPYGDRGVDRELYYFPVEFPGMEEHLFMYRNKITDTADRFQGLVKTENNEEGTPVHGGYLSQFVPTTFTKEDLAIPEECQNLQGYKALTVKNTIFTPIIPKPVEEIAF